MVHGRLSSMLGARLIPPTPSHHHVRDDRPPSKQAARSAPPNSAVASAACLEGGPGPVTPSTASDEVMGIASLNPSYDGTGVERRTPHLFRRRHDIDLPADRRTGVAAVEPLGGDRKLLGVLAVLPPPGLAGRQPPGRG